MKFQVPQFIDVEDKIFGPLTLRQFIYVAGGASITIAATTVLGIFWGLVVAAPIVILALALAFYRVNNRAFIFTMESAFKYIIGNKLYIWKKSAEIPKEEERTEKKYSSIIVPNLSKSKLRDMNWELDVKKSGEEDKTGL